MQLPPLKFTVRGMMVVIATFAVFWCSLVGIGALFTYTEHRQLEEFFRKGATTWDEKGEADRAAHWRRNAEQQAWLRQESRSRVITLALTGLGGALGGIGLMVRARYGRENTAWPGPVNTLAAVWLAGTKILLVGLILGGIVYFGLLLLVLAGAE